MSKRIAFAMLVAASGSLAATPVVAQPAALDLDQQTIRSISADICLPATASEYEAMGKYAIVALEMNSAIGTELPLRSAYVETDGVIVPMRYLLSSDPYEDDTGRTHMTSFYLMPTYLMTRNATLKADFRGSRRDFSVMTFSPGYLDPSAPAFVRLDEYAIPMEPDMKVVTEVLMREYPAYFS